MGGCKCIFRDCTNNSSNSPGMHFFHFPVKHTEKYLAWIKYSKADHILSIEAHKATNKVVCEMHFRDECFMNYKKDRLVKTAVPTLKILETDDDGKLVLDYEISDNPGISKIPVPTLKHLIPPDNSNIIVSPSTACKEIDPLKNEITENSSNEIYISTQNSLKNQGESVVIFDFNEFWEVEQDIGNSEVKEDELQIVRNKKRKQSSPKILNSSIKRLHLSPTTVINSSTITENITQQPNPNIKMRTSICPSFIERNPEIALRKQELKKVDKCVQVSTNECVKTFSEEKMQEIINKLKYDYEIKIEELKNTLKSKEKEILNVQTQVEKVTTSKSVLGVGAPLNKIQLFNGIKKYVSPSMSSFLRMEMFGRPEREWKEDEKEIAAELLQLGESVFKYVRDEWRFRLPSQNDVEIWIENSTNTN